MIIGLSFQTLVAQKADENIINALKSSNASGVAAYFHANVDLTIDQKQETYSKSQAEQILSNFFKANKPTDFKSNHSGISSEGSHYIIGELTTANGAFRVYIYFKNLNGADLIQTFRIEAEE